MTGEMEVERRPLPEAASRKYIARRLKIARIAMKRQQVEMAELIGMGRNTYQQWENGTNMPQRELVISYAAIAPEMSIDYIYLGRMEGLGKELRAKIEILEKLDEKSLRDLDETKGAKRPRRA